MNTAEELARVMRENDLITQAYSHYLNHTPRILSADMVTNLAKECDVTIHEAFLSLFAAVCGLEPDINPAHKALERAYLQSGIHGLDPVDYRNDPYCQAIRFPNQKNGAWEMRQGCYEPFEPFVCNHPVLTPALREIPQIGYFTERFSYPAVLENGVEWMTVTPNEIETMRAPIAKSHGRVLTLGLGLGYFAFSASEKENVTSVTVVERDTQVIDLFSAYILPQFPHKDKIRVIHADAFDYLASVDPNTVDYLFADLWHDPSDGLDLYLRLRKMERDRGFSQADYWIEPSLLSCLRHMVYDKLTDPSTPLRLAGIDPRELLSDAYLRRLAPDVRKAAPDTDTAHSCY